MNVSADQQAEQRTAALASELMRVTAGIRRLIRRHARGVLGPPLPQAQVELLLVVEGEPGIGVAAAARTLHLADNSVSALVNLLVSAGMLLRETDPVDRRAAHLHLTPAAKRRLARWRGARAELVGRGLDRIDPADREMIERALPALSRLLAELREQAEAGGA